jgi:hypothetical protein
MRRKYRWYGGLCTSVFVLCLLTMPPHGIAQELTPYDISRILLEAEQGFAHLVKLWKATPHEHYSAAGKPSKMSKVDLFPQSGCMSKLASGSNSENFSSYVGTIALLPGGF